MGPTFYVLTVVIVTIAKKESLFSSIGNPILMAFLFFCAAFVTRTTDTRKVLLYTLFTAYFYAFHLRPTLRLDAPIADERLPAAHESLDTLHHLSDFHFLTINGDSVQIPKGKPVLIETWNESCPPCVASINDLQGFLEQYTNIRHLYIYENKNNSSQNRQVFSYPKIKRPEKILMDIDLTYFKKTGMKSYPYFLVYDAQGKLIDYFSGYRSSNQQFYKERLDGMIQRAY